MIGLLRGGRPGPVIAVRAGDSSIPIGMRAMANLLVDFLEMQAAGSGN